MGNFKIFLDSIRKYDPTLVESIYSAYNVLIESINLSLEQAKNIAGRHYLDKDSYLHVFSKNPVIYDEELRTLLLNDINKCLINNEDRSERYELYHLSNFIKSMPLDKSDDFYKNLAAKTYTPREIAQKSKLF